MNDEQSSEKEALEAFLVVGEELIWLSAQEV